jgi:hypothetical protein
MTSFHLTTAIAVIITTSLASNLLWVMAFGTAAPGFRGRLRSALGEPFRGLRRLVGRPLSQLRARTAAEAKPR